MNMINVLTIIQMLVHHMFIVAWFVFFLEFYFSFKKFFSFKLKTLVESFYEAEEDFNAALEIEPTNLRARYQKLINDAKIGAKENRPERIEQALASFEEYYDTCKQDIYYALALTSVSVLIQ